MFSFCIFKTPTSKIYFYIEHLPLKLGLLCQIFMGVEIIKKQENYNVTKLNK